MESDDLDHPLCNCTFKKCDNTKNYCRLCMETPTDDYRRYSYQCERKCRKSCFDEFYQNSLFEINGEIQDAILSKYKINSSDIAPDTILVFIATKYAEEFHYTHTPKMSLFDFVAMIGGLFSLWVGASVIT